LEIPIEHGYAAGPSTHKANPRRSGKLRCNLAATNKAKSGGIAHHRLFADLIAVTDKLDGNGGNTMGRVIGLPISEIICFHLRLFKKAFSFRRAPCQPVARPGFLFPAPGSLIWVLGNADSG